MTITAQHPPASVPPVPHRTIRAENPVSAPDSPAVAMRDADIDSATGGPQPLAWGVVANIHTAGTKHFVGGAKVWVSAVQWGDGGERVAVIGHHRGIGHRLVKVVIGRKRLRNFRARPLFSPGIHRMFDIAGEPGIHYRSRTHAEESAAFAESLRSWYGR